MPYKNPNDKKTWHQKNKDRTNALNRASYAKNRDSRLAAIKKHKEGLRKRVLLAYGSQCSCCGETNERFLTIDHVNNDGYKSRGRDERGGTGLCRLIVRLGFPDSFQVLCWNCNLGKHQNGGVCPHNMDPNRDKGGNEGSGNPTDSKPRAPRTKGK